MIGAFVLDPFTSLLTYVRSDGSEYVNLWKPAPRVVPYDVCAASSNVIEHAQLRRYDFQVEVGGSLVMEAEEQYLLREALLRGKVDHKTGDVRVRIAVYAASNEAAEVVAQYAEDAVFRAVLYTTSETLHHSKRERRRLARQCIKRRMGCRRIPASVVVTTPRIDLRTLLALHDREFVEALRRGLPIRVETSGVPRCG